MREKAGGTNAIVTNTERSCSFANYESARSPKFPIKIAATIRGIMKEGATDRESGREKRENERYNYNCKIIIKYGSKVSPRAYVRRIIKFAAVAR